MPELLVELVSEPLPGWAQREGAPALAERIAQGLKEAGLLASDAQAPVVFATPFRLAAHVKGVLGAAPERIEERRGPREGAPDSALAGFMRSVGVDSKDALDLRLPKDGKGKARHWFASVRTPPAPARDLLPGVVAAAMQKLPWRKTMRWEGNRFRWPRVLRRCLVLLDGEALSMDGVDAPLPKGLVSGELKSVDAHGDPFPVASVADWKAQLKARGVFPMLGEWKHPLESEKWEEVNDPSSRLAQVQGWNKTSGAKVTLEGRKILRDSLEAQACAVEAPVPVFAKIPSEGALRDFPEVFAAMVIVQELRSSFWPEEIGEGRRFLFVAERPPGVHLGEEPREAWVKRVRLGVERVARARLADADFHWQHDKKTGIDALLEKTEGIQYHLKLGSVRDRAERLEKLSHFVAERIGFDAKLAKEAGRYSQADLASGLVQEVPKLESFVGWQLLMPSLLAASPDKVAIGQAIAHYKRAPKQARLEDREAPALPLCIADRVDALVGLWAAGERATGSGDPFALRRQALHLLEALSLEKCRDLSLPAVMGASIVFYANGLHPDKPEDPNLDPHIARILHLQQERQVDFSPSIIRGMSALVEFIYTRLENKMREEDNDIPYDVVRAAMFCPKRYNEGLVHRIREAAAALNTLLQENAGRALVAAWRRADGMLKVGAENYTIITGFSGTQWHVTMKPKSEMNLKGRLVSDSLEEGAERSLHNAICDVRGKIEAEDSVERQIHLLAQLRAPVDEFFEKVRILEGEERFQENRKALLAEFMYTVWQVANLGQLEGGERGASEGGSKSKKGTSAG